MNYPGVLCWVGRRLARKTQQQSSTSQCSMQSCLEPARKTQQQSSTSQCSIQSCCEPARKNTATVVNVSIQHAELLRASLANGFESRKLLRASGCSFNWRLTHTIDQYVLPPTDVRPPSHRGITTETSFVPKRSELFALDTATK